MNTESLRDRKRAATYAAIHAAAAKLVDERGYDAVTVEDICEEVGISRRTLFNYVDSKEQAVVGSVRHHLTEEDKAAFLDTPHSNVLKAITELWLTRVLSGDEHEEMSPSQLCQRHRAMMRHPQLAARRREDLIAAQHDMAELVAALLEKRGETDKSRRTRRAEALTTTAAMALHMGYHRWMTSDHPTRAELRRACREALDDVIDAVLDSVDERTSDGEA